MPKDHHDRTDTSPARYSADIAAGSLLLPESRKIAQLLLNEVKKVGWHRAIVLDNVLQKRSPDTARRQARLIRNRLRIMTADHWKMVRDGSSELATQALLASAIKQSRLLADYMDHVLRQHVRTFESHLKTEEWSRFLEACEQLDPAVASWSETTTKKLRQVIIRILAEARYLENTRSRKLTPVSVIPGLKDYLLEHQEHAILRCMEIYP